MKTKITTDELKKINHLQNVAAYTLGVATLMLTQLRLECNAPGNAIFAINLGWYIPTNPPQRLQCIFPEEAKQKELELLEKTASIAHAEMELYFAKLRLDCEVPHTAQLHFSGVWIFDGKPLVDAECLS